MYELRDYQIEAVKSGVKFLKGKAQYNAIMVLPTGSGKSLVIANLIAALNEPTLVFQPSKEILEQNIKKLEFYGFKASIYSASLNSKFISKITFATIGSVKDKADLFRHFKYIIVDECHLVNPKKGMYKEFLNMLGNSKVLGLTATPYRLSTDGWGGSILKFLTRTRPRIFKELIYFIQNKELFDNGYLAKLQYHSVNGFDRSHLTINSTGADYTDKSLKDYYGKINFPEKVLKVVNRLIEIKRKNILVFTRFVEESEYLVKNINSDLFMGNVKAAIVTAETSKAERERIIKAFRSGEIKIVCNVAILTTGFDYPELETIVLARATVSLALYYQMIGRSIRPHPLKESAMIIDMCKNMELFGKIEDFSIEDGGNGKWFIANNQTRKQLTNAYFQGYERFAK